MVYGMRLVGWRPPRMTHLAWPLRSSPSKRCPRPPRRKRPTTSPSASSAPAAAWRTTCTTVEAALRRRASRIWVQGCAPSAAVRAVAWAAPCAVTTPLGGSARRPSGAAASKTSLRRRQRPAVPPAVRPAEPPGRHRRPSRGRRLLQSPANRRAPKRHAALAPSCPDAWWAGPPPRCTPARRRRW